MLDPSPFRSRGPDNSLSFFVLVGPRGSTNLLLWTLRIRSVLYSFYWTLRRSSYIVDQRIQFPFLIWTLRIQLLRGPRGSNFRRCLGPWGSSFMWTQRIQRSLYFGPRGSICFILDPEDPFKIFLYWLYGPFRLIYWTLWIRFWIVDHWRSINVLVSGARKAHYLHSMFRSSSWKPAAPLHSTTTSIIVLVWGGVLEFKLLLLFSYSK